MRFITAASFRESGGISPATLINATTLAGGDELAMNF
jgi:hypothetical protein